MRISHKHKFVFLAMPRTGSTTTRRVLDRYSDIKSVHPTGDPNQSPFVDHVSASELKAVFESRGWQWDEYLKFCFVRNPYDRVVSLYHHKIKNMKNKTYPGLKGALRRARNAVIPPKTFREYVEWINPETRLPTCIKAFAFDDSDNCLVDEILKFEELNKGLFSILNRCNISISPDQIPHLNASAQRLAYRAYYDEHTKGIVQRLYKYEIERFGYTF